MKNKLLLIIISIAVLILGSSIFAFASSNEPTFTVGQVTAEGGAVVEVPVLVSGNPGICGATVMVTYDERLNLTGITAGEAFSKLTMTKPGDMTMNPAKILWDGVEADSSNGVIAKLSFIVPKTVGTYPIYVTYTSGDIVDGDLNPVEFQIENGSITVQSQTNKDLEAATAVEAIINNMNPTDRTSVANARAAYDALTDAQKAYVNPEVLAKLTEAEEALAAADEQARVDQAAADNVTKLINAIDPGQRETVEAARAAYDALTDTQKTLISYDVYKRLTDAELYIQMLDEQYALDKAAADEVAALINACDPSDRESVAAARAAYDALDDSQKNLVDPEVYAKLTEAEATIMQEDNKLKDDQEAADAVIEAILACDPNDKQSVEAARAAYEALTEDQKALVDEETLKILTDAEEKIQQTEEPGKKSIRDEGILLLHEAEWNGGRAVRPYDDWIMRKSDYSFLYEGQDYEVTYSNNHERGTAKAKITGVGDYTGEINTEFEIVPYSMDWCFDKDLKFVVLKSTNLVYNGKSRTVTLKVNADIPGDFVKGTDYTISYPNGNKNVGKHTAVVKCKGNYEGEGTFTFKVLPKGTTLGTVTAGKKTLTVKWKKQSAKMSTSRITGYQVQIAKNSKFTKGKKTATVKGYSKLSKKFTNLTSKKTYYVRVRTYKKINGTNYYSKWSKSKSIKVK